MTTDGENPDPGADTSMAGDFHYDESTRRPRAPKDMTAERFFQTPSAPTAVVAVPPSPRPAPPQPPNHYPPGPPVQPPADGYQAGAYTYGYPYPGPPGPPYPGAEPTRQDPPSGPRQRSRWLPVAVIAALVGALAGGAVGAAVASGRDGQGNTVVNEVIQPNSSIIAHPATIREILAKVQPGVVSISTNLGAGTGMIVTADGQVLTNAHVIAKASRISVTLYNSTTPQPATLLGADSTDDVALLQITGASGLPTVSLGDSTKLQVGDDVVAIGNALNLAGGPTVTSGIISAIGRTLRDPSLPPNLIQTDAAINPGNSGGPLANSSGQVIGMNTLVIQQANSQEAAQNLGFAIPINNIKPLLADLAKGVNRAPGYMGVSVADMTPQISQRLAIKATSGAIVEPPLDANGPAAQGGIQVSDVIVNFDGKPVSDSSGLVTLIRAHKPGDKVPVTVVRGQSNLTVTVTLGAKPSSP